MREIKFRLFHKSKATVVYFTPLVITFTDGFWEKRSPIDNYELSASRDDKNLSGLSVSGYNHNDFNRLIEQNDYILMQYTGMKDKNGNEIYEWDIVKAPYKEETIRVVQWLDGYNGYTFLEHFETSKHFEIIGNIYTTPELIKNV